MLTKIYVFQTLKKKHIFQTLSRPGCPVQVTHRPTCPARPVSAVLSQLSGPRCPVLTHLSCPDSSVLSCPDSFVLSWLVCPVLAVLFQLPYPGHIGHCSPNTSVMSWQQCFGSASVFCGSGSGSYLKTKCGSGFVPWRNRIGIYKDTCIKI